jgi:paraquat-inducible protein A
MPAEILACKFCDLLNQVPLIRERATARCSRCGAVLINKKRNSIDRTLALTMTAAVLFVIANLLPFLSFDMNGRTAAETTLSSGVFELYDQGELLLSGLVLVTAILAPGLELSMLLYVLLGLKMRLQPWGLALVFRTLVRLRPWSMMEVFLIGILVALVKLTDEATILAGPGIWFFGVLVITLAGAAFTLNDRAIWRQVSISR